MRALLALRHYASSSHPVVPFCRPYLHMFAHSNEVEEIGVISLAGVNVENNPEMEALLGVRSFRLLRGPSANFSSCPSEKVHVHSLHVFQLICAICTKPEGAPSMDYEAGPDPTSFMTYHDFSRHGISTYALYFCFHCPSPSLSPFLSLHVYALHCILLVLSRQSLSLAYL